MLAFLQCPTHEIFHLQSRRTLLVFCQTLQIVDAWGLNWYITVLGSRTATTSLNGPGRPDSREEESAVNTTLLALVAWASLGQAHKAPGVEQILNPKLTLIEQQVPGMWVMEEFSFIQPRMITMDVPGKGKKLFWYMVYRVKNKGDQPRLFVPKFLLVDDKGNAFLDRINPKVQRAVQLREGPMQPLENSISAVGMIQPSAD